MCKSNQENGTQKNKESLPQTAEHVVKCGMIPGKKRVKRKLLTELYVNGNFTQDRRME